MCAYTRRVIAQVGVSKQFLDMVGRGSALSSSDPYERRRSSNTAGGAMSATMQPARVAGSRRSAISVQHVRIGLLFVTGCEKNAAPALLSGTVRGLPLFDSRLGHPFLSTSAAMSASNSPRRNPVRSAPRARFRTDSSRAARSRLASVADSVRVRGRSAFWNARTRRQALSLGTLTGSLRNALFRIARSTFQRRLAVAWAARRLSLSSPCGICAASHFSRSPVVSSDTERSPRSGMPSRSASMKALSVMKSCPLRPCRRVSKYASAA